MRSIVVFIFKRRLFLYDSGKVIKNYPVAVGKPSTPTPIGMYSIRHKLKNPGGLFGTRWMSFKPHYGIHGTNRPDQVGQAVSHGCIRMYNHDVEELYELVDVGTPVEIIYN
ncbi:MAG: L,D-transpeptidase [Halanaerobiales bacterium]|nr:L,D-transpeptidase [Halanaerobiales bacterium]